MEETIGKKLKRLRTEAHLTKAELARRSGVSWDYIYQLELETKTKSITLRKAQQLAKGLGLSANTFIDGDSETYPPISTKLKLDGVVAIPVYTEFPFHASSEGREEPADYVYRREIKEAGKEIEAYIVRGTCLEPAIYEGDIIIVDREREIENGDIVACQINGELHLARLKKIAGELWLENNHGHQRMQDCQVSAVVIGINRKLK